MRNQVPGPQGLYDPKFEHDACGIGFIAHAKGYKSNSILKQGIQILLNLDHRGACGCEPNTGDGAGILIQIPHVFFQNVCSPLGITLPAEGHYGVGMVFLPQDAVLRKAFQDHFNEIAQKEGQKVLGWRDVPVNDVALGSISRSAMPFICQVFIEKSNYIPTGLPFERKLYIIRKQAEGNIRYSDQQGGESFYIASLSSMTIVFKGMLTPGQLEDFYPDLLNTEMVTAIALVHSRFSTNTFPSWERAHPNRFLAHNGEINTLRGNINWMNARQAIFRSPHFGDDLKKVFPVIDPDGSDSSMLDNSLEFLMLGGYSMPHAVMMMIPEPWSRHETMSDSRKAFYEYHSCLMEPWDGPACIAFTDGIRVGAVLDRNGLRPSRYYLTQDDLVIMASEVGVLDIAPENIRYKGRLQPGKIFLVDTQLGRVITDDEIKDHLAAQHPYRQWLDENLIDIDSLPAAGKADHWDRETLLDRQRTFGYTYEELRLLIAPMASQGVEAIGSMGVDTPLAVLSDKPQLLYNYFKQLFAQVTNPPIDAIREEIVMGTETSVGPEGNLLQPGPENCRQIKIPTPVLTDDELVRLRDISLPGLKAAVLTTLFPAAKGPSALKTAMDDLCKKADEAVAQGSNILILSDRGMNAHQVPIPALMAVAGVHHHLIRNGNRPKVGLIVDSGEPREVHHFALLLGYGAGGINPYLAYETLKDMVQQGLLPGIEYKKAVANYRKAVMKGIIKVISKMGISTIQSYQGAQIFEAVGIGPAVIEKYFTGTPSRIGGIDLEAIATESLIRHQKAYNPLAALDRTLDTGGNYQWRKEGEYHLYNPETIYKLQVASRSDNYALYKEYAEAINQQMQQLHALRGLLEFEYAKQPVPIEEVESIDAILKRFKTGAMSFGSISKEAHECLAIAMNRLGGKSNTGEGGEDPDRFVPDDNGDSRASAIKQVASGRFGVTSEYLVNAKEIQIKMAQGAKPGEGGQLPGRKVYPWVAKVRITTPGVGLISPPPHHDIYSIEDLAQLIHDLKNANPEARISVKLVSEVGVGTIAAGVAKARADVVLISGYDGGTGASPRTSIYHTGLPWELGLAETHQTLMLNNLRSRIVVETDGKLMTGRDVAVAALLGAEEFGFATAPLVVLGCVMMRVCHMDTCPVGVATQNPELRKNFTGKPEYVVNLLKFIASDLREIMALLGFRTLDEMVGRTDRLKNMGTSLHWKAKTLDLSSMLYMPSVDANVGKTCQMQQDHGIERSLDSKVLLPLCMPAIEAGETIKAVFPIHNTDRVVGTTLGSEITRRFGAKGLSEDSIHLTFNGSAGQSFGAFIPKGITLSLIGDANDYLGKGLSGGKIVVSPSPNALFASHKNVIIGNVALYGATSGQAYIRGLAGERFCVRNSGATAVVEGVGDHGCEYMTGGRVVILGPTGRNFAAGMSGGIAYVLDEDRDFYTRMNTEMVLLETIEDETEYLSLKMMVERHAEYTLSPRAKDILRYWDDLSSYFVKVISRDYKRMLDAYTRAHQAGLSGDAAVMAAFNENSKDLARVGGN